jgi:hypothetical protein
MAVQLADRFNINSPSPKRWHDDEGMAGETLGEHGNPCVSSSAPTNLADDPNPGNDKEDFSPTIW